MRGSTQLTLVGLALLLISCAGNKNIENQVNPTPTELALPTKTETASPEATAVLLSETGAIPGCTVVSPFPTPGPTEQSLFPPVGEQDWTRGPGNAAVTIVEYSDFQCPYCSQLADALAQLEKDFPEDLQVVFRHFPLIGTPERPFHDKAALSAQAAEAAGMQGKFWEMHDLLYEEQSQWALLAVDVFQEWLLDKAGELGLDVERFQQDLTDAKIAALAQEAWERGQEIGLPGTPFLLVNGRIWPTNVPMDYFTLSTVIKLDLLEKKQFTLCPPMTIDSLKQYFAVLNTSKGEIRLELFAEQAPLAVNSFIFLARNGWFDGVTFHRVIPGFVAQAGDPTGTGYGGPGYAFENKISPDLKFDRAGLLAMANAGPGSNGSQFFITYSPTPDLDGGYTIFGRVVEGMEVVSSLTPRDPSQSANLPPGDVIESITIEEK